jgi:hypothetical protein
MKANGSKSRKTRIADMTGRLFVAILLVLSANVAWGQFRGGGGSGRGGAGVEAFLRGMDTNGNGMIDADEAAGRRRLFVDRLLARLKIEPVYPISIDKIVQASANPDRNQGNGAASPAATTPPASTFVPSPSALSFSKPTSSTPAVPGFGQPSSTAATPTSPVQATPPAAQPAPAPAPAAADPAKPADKKLKRFLLPKERLPQGIFEWFSEKDTDGDGQVTMAEFAQGRKWTDTRAAEFDSYDLNHDGVITPAECLKAAKDSRR